MIATDTPVGTMRVRQPLSRWLPVALWAAGGLCFLQSVCGAQIIIRNGVVVQDEQAHGGFTVKKVDPKITDAISDFNRYAEKQAWEKAFKAIAPLAETEPNGMIPQKDGFYFPARQAVMNTFLAMSPEGREAYRLFNDAKAKRLYDQATKHPDSSDDDVVTLRKLLGLYFITSIGHQAADRLGDDLFESGDFGGAEQAWAAIVEQQASSDLSIPRIQLKRGIAMVRTKQLTRARQIVSWLKDHAAGSKTMIGGKDVEPAEYLQSLIDSSATTEPAAPTTQFTSVPESELPPIVLPTSDTPKWHFQFGDEQVSQQITQCLTQFGWASVMPDLLAIVPGSAADERHAYINWLGVCYGIDARTGKLLWRSDKPSDIAQNVQQFVQFCPEVRRYTAAAAGDRVLFVRIPPRRMNYNEPYRLCCFNAQTGAQQWSSESGTLSGYSFACVPLVVDETVYATASNNNGTEIFLIAIDITRGRSQWSLSLGQGTGGTNWRGMPQIPVCNLLYDAGKIYVLTNNGALLCVNAGEKRVLWAMTMEGPPVSSGPFWNQGQPIEKIRTPAAMFRKDNVLYLKERDADDIYAVDLSAPSLKWKRPADGDETILGIDNGRVYTAGRDVGAIDSASHALLWSTRLPLLNGTYRPMMSGESIFYFAGRGIYQIDAANGDIQRIFRGYDRDSSGGAIYQSAIGIITVSDKALTAYPNGPGITSSGAGLQTLAK